MPREKSAGVIIFRREEGNIYYLLLHYPAINRKGGHWEFAKGHVEGNESEEETAKREASEETGINDLNIIPGFKKYIKYFFKQGKDIKTRQNKKPSWIFKLVIFFIGETKIKDINLSPEHIGYEWLPYQEAYQKITYKNSKELLKKADEFIKTI